MLEALPSGKSVFFPTCWTQADAPVVGTTGSLGHGSSVGILWILGAERAAQARQGIVDIRPSFLSKVPS